MEGKDETPILRLTAGETSGENQTKNDPERPTDEEILQQRNRIRDEVLNSPLIGPLDTIASYEQEFLTGNEYFLKKIQFLGQSYRNIRRVRRDGNCFFRSFIFNYVESLLVAKDLTERDRAKAQLDRCKDKLLAAGYQELVFEDALGILRERVGQIGAELTLPEWEIVMNDDHLSSYIIMFLRLLTAAEIFLRKDYFAPYIMGTSDILDVELYCRQMVEVMDEESDEIHIRALTDSLGIPTRIFALDSRPPAEITPTDYVPEECSGDAFYVHLLYRPGHYDIIYKS